MLNVEQILEQIENTVRYYKQFEYDEHAQGSVASLLELAETIRERDEAYDVLQMCDELMDLMDDH